VIDLSNNDVIALRALRSLRYGGQKYRGIIDGEWVNPTVRAVEKENERVK